MMSRDFDPYDALIELNERISMLEKAHNKMAHAFQRSEVELTTTLQLLKSLQLSHAHLNELVFDAFLQNGIPVPDMLKDPK